MELKGIDILNRVTLLLNRRQIKQRKFLQDLGLSFQAPIHWRQGAVPSLQVIYDIAEYFNVSVDWLITGVEIEPTYEYYSFSTMLKRIDERIESMNKNCGLPCHNWEDGFYTRIEDIINPADFDNLINGRNRLTISQLIALADKLSLSIQYLITGKEISDEVYKHYYGSLKDIDDEMFYSYHSLNDDTKQKVKDYVNAVFKAQLYDHSQKVKQNNENC